MKHMGRMGRMGLMTLVAALGAMLWMASPARAQTSIGGITYGTFAGIPATVALSSTTNATSTAILVRQNRGIGLLATFTDASNTGGAVTVSYDVSCDGTNYSSVRPIRWVLDSTLTNSSGVVIGYTNVPSSYLNNIRWLRVSRIQNASTNGLTAVSLQYSYSNTSSP